MLNYLSKKFHSNIIFLRVHHDNDILEPTIKATDKGIHTLEVTFFVMTFTVIFQLIIVIKSNSIGLFAGTISSLGDLFSTIPLFFAFLIQNLKPSKKFTYGYGRFEDLMGLVVVIMVFASGIFSLIESFSRLFDTENIDSPIIVIFAAIIGFIGNISIARYEIKNGKSINSAALVADGKQSQITAISSIAVIIGTLGYMIGFPHADAIVGFFISGFIFYIGVEIAISVLIRLLDGIDPEVIDDIEYNAKSVEGVLSIKNIRLRWIGHRVHVELKLSVDGDLSLKSANEISEKVRKKILRKLKYISDATIHIQPKSIS